MTNGLKIGMEGEGQPKERRTMIDHGNRALCNISSPQSR